jgi:putative protease
MCRLPYTLEDGNGKVLLENKHLLSLKDMNRSTYIKDMIEAGVSSFKIEGRLKDVGYVKNTVAYYRQAILTIYKKYDIIMIENMKRSFE